MRGMHNLLPAKIPHVEAHILLTIKLGVPFSDLDAFGLFLTSFEDALRPWKNEQKVFQQNRF
jgi:hypothetical protein